MYATVSTHKLLSSVNSDSNTSTHTMVTHILACLIHPYSDHHECNQAHVNQTSDLPRASRQTQYKAFRARKESSRRPLCPRHHHRSSQPPFAAISLCGVAGLSDAFTSFPVCPISKSSLMLKLSSVRSLLTVSSHCNFGPSSFLQSSARLFFCFISSFFVPEPFQTSPSHDHRYRLHPCFLQAALISPMFCSRTTVLPPLPIAPLSFLCCHVRFSCLSLTDIGHSTGVALRP